MDAPGADLDRVQRSFYTSSSCGVCGKGALEAVAVEAPRIESPVTVAFDVVAALPGRLREAQAAFALTGGLHATGLFTPEGELRCVREDVGRHNAMDKVLGWSLGQGLVPLAESVLVVERPAFVRARPEGLRCGLPGGRRRRRPLVARRGA